MNQRSTCFRTRAFTLVEVMVVTAMTAFLFMMMAGMWRGIGSSVADSLVNARVAQEAHFVVEIMRRDLGGFLPGEEEEEEDENKLVGRLTTTANQLMLCFDSNNPDGLPDWGKPDTVIVYEMKDNQLWRIEQTNKGKYFVVANYVTEFTPTQMADGIQVDFTITYEDISRTYTLIAQDP